MLPRKSCTRTSRSRIAAAITKAAGRNRAIFNRWWIQPAAARFRDRATVSQDSSNTMVAARLSAEKAART